jgi:hypothetical protein
MAMKIKTIAITVALLSTTAYAQQYRAGNFHCVPEWSGGGIYNQSVKRWQATSFHINDEDKFVLQLHFIATDTQNYDHYRVTITNAGSNTPRSCFTDNLLSDVTVDGLGVIRCNRDLILFKFSMKTNRFLMTYSVGYIDGIDIDGDTPFLTGGTCTRME